GDQDEVAGEPPLRAPGPSGGPRRGRGGGVLSSGVARGVAHVDPRPVADRL
ncbi:MAG: hypothetical protein AVDCRST_MAG24-203, partial [uncultured Nocardioidaceae bacterium]